MAANMAAMRIKSTYYPIKTAALMFNGSECMFYRPRKSFLVLKKEMMKIQDGRQDGRQIFMQTYFACYSMHYNV